MARLWPNLAFDQSSLPCMFQVGPNLMQYFPAVDPLEGQLLRSCAVVGNGAILLHGPPRGKAIDSHTA
eukprot:scaffold638164_cov33-Prasinocladus_malaysianus.AAC.1